MMKTFIVTVILVKRISYDYSVLKTDHWYKIKDLIREKTIRSFMKKNYGWVNYKWVVIQNQIVIKLEV